MFRGRLEGAGAPEGAPAVPDTPAPRTTVGIAELEITGEGVPIDEPELLAGDIPAAPLTAPADPVTVGVTIGIVVPASAARGAVPVVAPERAPMPVAPLGNAGDAVNEVCGVLKGVGEAVAVEGIPEAPGVEELAPFPPPWPVNESSWQEASATTLKLTALEKASMNGLLYRSKTDTETVFQAVFQGA